ncbi:MAG: hypothetical protein KF782_08710 [Labilithrix sp.]|nr:hypothetical protein [Labilithrix sp.]
MNFFDDRAASTRTTLEHLARRIEDDLGEDAERVLAADTCIYVVGSGGRGEMSRHSDADLFVARVRRDPSDVDAFLVRQAIARALFKLGLPPPSQGGSFLKMHTAEDLRRRLGTPEDDAGNTLTARMLLLLESQPLLGAEAYGVLVNVVLEAYWTDAAARAETFQPFALVNDVVRYWRILLLNYVAKNAERETLRESQSERDAQRALRSYKLRFSRCMTCFSVLASLLAVTAEGGVSKEAVLDVIRRTPVERLRALRAASGPSRDRVERHVETLLRLYEQFLKTTDQEKSALLEALKDPELARRRIQEGREFGDAMFELLQGLGHDGRARELFRHMVV